MNLYMADATFLAMRPTSIELALPLANIHTNLHLLHTPIFDALYRLMPLLDHQTSLDSCRAMTQMCMVHLYSLPLKQILIFSIGLQMALGCLTMTPWVSWRGVLVAVIFFLAVSFVIILLLAPVVNDVV